MLLSKLGLFILALVIGIACAIGISTILKHLGRQRNGVGCVSGLFLTFGFWILLMFIMPQIVIITGSDEDLDDKKSYALFEYDGHSVNFCGKYLDNRSTERLIIYPQYYSSSKEQTEISDIEDEDEDVTLIEPNSFTEIKHLPDHFFHAPSVVRSKHKGKTQVEWIIDRYSKLENEYLNKVGKRQKFINEHILNEK